MGRGEVGQWVRVEEAAQRGVGRDGGGRRGEHDGGQRVVVIEAGLVGDLIHDGDAIVVWKVSSRDGIGGKEGRQDGRMKQREGREGRGR